MKKFRFNKEKVAYGVRYAAMCCIILASLVFFVSTFCSSLLILPEYLHDCPEEYKDFLLEFAGAAMMLGVCGAAIPSLIFYVSDFPSRFMYDPGRVLSSYLAKISEEKKESE